jgi:hypothetical protein
MRTQLVPTLAAIALSLLPSSSASGQVSSSGQFITVKATHEASDVVPVGDADFNGDGKIDLLATGHFRNSTGKYVPLALLLGKGDGSFTTVPITNFAPSNPSQTIYQVADVNGDNFADLIASDPGPQNCPPKNPGCGVYLSGSITVALGNGNGTFQTPKRYTGGNFIPSSFVLADVNNDGKPDLIVLTAPHSPSSVRYGELQVLINDGNGTFRQGSRFASSITRLFGTGDFTNNGRQDIAGVDSNDVLILKNLGNGSLRLAATYSVPSVTSLGVADFNHDGHADLVVAEDYGPLILLGNGDYNFRTTPDDGSAAITFPLGLQTNSHPVLFGDFNNDGYLDFAVHQYAYFGHGDGTFTFSKVYGSGPGGAQLLADINGDNLPDLIGNADKSLIVLFGNTNGIFNVPLQTVTLPNTQSMATADFDHDGILDLVVFGPAPSNDDQKQAMSVYPGTNRSYFAAPKNFLIPAGQPLVGDVNKDGYQDVVIVFGNTITVLLGRPGFTFAAPRTSNLLLPAEPSTHVSLRPNSIATLADVDNDGNLDLVGLFGVSLGNGHGTFRPAIPLGFDTSHVRQIVLGNLTNDKHVDMVVLSTQSEPSQGPVTLSVLLGNGHGHFRSVSPLHVGQCKYCSGVPSPGGFMLLDLNGDNRADLIYTATTKNSFGVMEDLLEVQLVNGNGTFDTPIVQPLVNRAMFGPRTQIVLTADFDLDGNIDVAVPTEGGFVDYLRGLGKGRFAAPNTYLIDDQYLPGSQFSPDPDVPTSYSVLDINGDGFPDILKALPTENTPGVPGAITRLLNSGAQAGANQ